MSAMAGTISVLLGIEDAAELDRVTAQAEAIVRTLPGPARLGLAAGAGTLDVLARLTTGHSLDGLDAGRRDALCTLLESRAARAVEAVKIPLLLAAGTGLLPGPPEPGGLVRPDAVLDCTPSADWPACATADAVVVGSGAGGAMAARTLARRGMSVVVLEEGRRFTAAEFRERPPLDRFLDLYRDGGATVAVGRPPVLLPRAARSAGRPSSTAGPATGRPAGCFGAGRPLGSRWRTSVPTWTRSRPRCVSRRSPWSRSAATGCSRSRAPNGSAGGPRRCAATRRVAGAARSAP